MSNVISFQTAKKKQLKQKKSLGRKNLLCQNGHHKWQIVKARRFDVSEGKLATEYVCKYCHQSKTEYH